MKEQVQQVKALLEWVKIFNATSSLTNFEIQKYYQDELKINGVYSRNNLPKIKEGTYDVITFDTFKSIGNIQ